MFLKHTKWALIWALIILILCGIPGKDVPEVSIVNFDKFVHASIFFVLLLLTVRGFSLQTEVTVLHHSPKTTAFVLCVIYGGTIELMQGAFFVDRTADINDFVANSFGCLAGSLLYDKIATLSLKNRG
jgi:VanZ family protein